MANELMTPEMHGLTVFQTERGLSELLKPLTKEIFLLETYIEGTTRLKEPGVLRTVRVNDSLTLRREASKFDEMAILVLTEEGKKLGYIPEKDNVIFARLMDAGKCLKAKVKSSSEKNGFREIRIGLYLVDF